MADNGETPEVPQVASEEADHTAVIDAAADDDPMSHELPSTASAVDRHATLDSRFDSSKITDALKSELDSLLQKELTRVQSQLKSAFEAHLETVRAELKSSVETALGNAEKTAQGKLESHLEEVKAVAKEMLRAEISHYFGLHVGDRLPPGLRDFVNDELSKVKAEVRAEMQEKLSQAEQKVFGEIKAKVNAGTDNLKQELNRKVAETKQELKSHVKTVLFDQDETDKMADKMAEFEARVEQRLLQIEVGFETGFIDLKKNAKAKIQKFEERIKEETRGNLTKWLTWTIGIVLLCTVGTIINVMVGHHKSTTT